MNKPYLDTYTPKLHFKLVRNGRTERKNWQFAVGWPTKLSQWW
jgi:hypothetical protein